MDLGASAFTPVKMARFTEHQPHWVILTANIKDRIMAMADTNPAIQSNIADDKAERLNQLIEALLTEIYAAQRARQNHRDQWGAAHISASSTQDQPRQPEEEAGAANADEVA
jgi:hypothetical protein